MKGCSISNVGSEKGGVLYAMSNNNITISLSLFNNISGAFKGGLLYFVSNN